MVKGIINRGKGWTERKSAEKSKERGELLVWASGFPHLRKFNQREISLQPKAMFTYKKTTSVKGLLNYLQENCPWPARNRWMFFFCALRTLRLCGIESCAGRINPRGTRIWGAGLGTRRVMSAGGGRARIGFGAVQTRDRKSFLRVTEFWPNTCESDMSKKWMVQRAGCAKV